MAPKVIQTRRLTLRQPTEADVAAVYRYASDPEVTRHMDWMCLTNPDQVLSYFARCDEEWASGAEYTWLLADVDTGIALGGISCRLRGSDADFGYVLARYCWGKGIATEAASAIVSWSFSLPETRRVWATCDVENIRSARVLEKAGLAREGLLPGGMVRPNISQEPRDAYVYSRRI